jgi:acetyl esterase
VFIFLKLFFKLPAKFLLWLSGKDQIVTKGNRRLDPGFQLLLHYMGDDQADFSLPASKIREEIAKQTKTFSSFAPPFPKSINFQDHEINRNGNVICIREYVPKDIQESASSLVYFHGGGWALLDIESHHRFTAFLAKELNAKVFSVDYSLAPEKPYPQGLYDCEAAFNWVRENHKGLAVNPEKISVGGDSAGGNLAAALCLKCNQEEKYLPRAQLLLYPATALDFLHPSIEELSEGFMLTKEAMLWFRDQYLSDQSLVYEPLVSPLLAESLSGLPPAVIVTAGFDPLRDEGDRYAESLIKSGVETHHLTFDGYIHGFANMELISGVDDALKLICDDFKKVF